MWIYATIAAATVAFAAAQEIKLPEGEGKEIVQRICTACHSAERIVREHLSAEEWENLIAAMEDEGAEIENDEYETLVKYLVANFGPDKKPK